jgi:CheY-like chemotaxis protein/broad specificity phosphatase PhoE
MDQDTFIALVRDALSRLYDLSYLSRHDLREALFPGAGSSATGQDVHRALLEGMERLHPPERVPPTSNAWRPYLVLSLRYAEERTAEQTAQEMGISLRQLRREQAHAIEMLASIVRQATLPHPADRQPSHDPETASNDVARLGEVHSETLTSVDKVVQSVLDTLRRHAESRRVTLVSHIPPNLPPLHVERAALRQMLLNLLTHSIEVSNESVVRISVRRLRADVHVEVQAGHASAGQNSPERDERLAVAAQLAAAQGGRLQIAEDGSLSLTIILPAQPMPVVLVIDDNPEMIQLFRRYLGGLYEVVSATTGEEGLRLARETRASAVTLDVMMPDQDGWEILQNLKNQTDTHALPVIVCSVLKERDLAFSLGANQFLEKPVTQHMLLRALAECTAGVMPTTRREPLSGSA